MPLKHITDRSQLSHWKSDFVKCAAHFGPPCLGQVGKWFYCSRSMVFNFFFEIFLFTWSSNAEVLISLVNLWYLKKSLKRVTLIYNYNMFVQQYNYIPIFYSQILVKFSLLFVGKIWVNTVSKFPQNVKFNFKIQGVLDYRDLDYRDPHNTVIFFQHFFWIYRVKVSSITGKKLGKNSITVIFLVKSR